MPTVDCPTCGRKLRVADDLAAAAVQCPRCGTTFEGPDAPAEAPPPRRAEEDDVLPAGPPPPPGVPPPPRPLRPVLLSSSTEPGPPPAGPADVRQTCPVCGSREPEHMRQCSVCGSELQGGPSRERLPPRRDYEPDRGSLISVLGTVSVLFSLPGLCGLMFWPFTLASAVASAVGITALVMAHNDLDQMDRNVMDPRGRDSTLSGKGQASIGTALGLIGFFLGGVVQLLILFGRGW